MNENQMKVRTNRNLQGKSSWQVGMQNVRTEIRFGCVSDPNTETAFPIYPLDSIKSVLPPKNGLCFALALALWRVHKQCLSGADNRVTSLETRRRWLR